MQGCMPIGKVKLKASPPTTIRIIKASPPTTIRITIAKQTRGTGIIPAFIVEPRLGLHRLCPPMPPSQRAAYRHRRIKWQCLAPPSKWPKSLCPPMSQRGFHITPLELVLFGPNDVKERSPLVEGGMGG